MSISARVGHRGKSEQIRLESALYGLAQSRREITLKADGDRLFLADFILEDAQRLIEIVHHKIAEAVANSLPQPF